MSYARLANNTVLELIPDFFNDEGEAVPLDQRFTPDFVADCIAVPAGEPVAQGWSFSDGKFSPPTFPKATIPSSVTMRQARLALMAAGKLQSVSDAIAALPSPQREVAQIEWDYASTVQRDSLFVQQLAAELNLAPEELDALFTQAAAL